jgi:DNA-binding IclR family transcriptional regulator
MIEEGRALARPSVEMPSNRHLDTIVKRGHLIAESHDVIGITDIAAPILDRHGHALAGIVVPYLTRRGTAAVHDRVLKPLLDTCRAISAALR